MDEEKIKRQAKELLDKFAKALEVLSQKEPKEVELEREKERRKEGEGINHIDREIMFSNAPKKKGDFIEAEKGGWV